MQEYLKDGRMPISELYKYYDRLEEAGWIKEEIFDYKRSLRTYAYRTKKKGGAIWLLAGIHGEEPAGPNAIALSIDKIIKFGNKFPMIVIPLLNPSGYYRDWRHIHRRRFTNKNRWYCNDIGDADMVLIDSNGKPKGNKPDCVAAGKLVRYIIEKSKSYRPRATINLHEDEKLDKGYVYSHGKYGENDKVAKKVLKILEKHIPMSHKGKTRFGEEIVNGIVAVKEDGSIDEMLGAEKIRINGKITKWNNATSVIVVETPLKNIKLNKRIEAHAEIIRNLDRLYH